MTFNKPWNVEIEQYQSGRVIRATVDHRIMGGKELLKKVATSGDIRSWSRQQV